MRCPNSPSRRRGVALLIAISVLTILTIIVYGVAASYQFTIGYEKTGENRQTAINYAHTGLDYGLGLLEQRPGDILGKTRTVPFDNAFIAITGRQAAPRDAFYQGRFISPRPGDAVLTIRVQHGKTPRVTRLTREFLVNVSPEHKRVVLLWEKTGETPAFARADRPAAEPSQQPQGNN